VLLDTIHAIHILVNISQIAGGIIMLTSWLIPGFFILTKKPWYAAAWLQGISLPGKKFLMWEQMSAKLKKGIYVYSTMFLVVVPIGIILTVIDLFLRNSN
jgi:hypothetical protein